MKTIVSSRLFFGWEGVIDKSGIAGYEVGLNVILVKNRLFVCLCVCMYVCRYVCVGAFLVYVYVRVCKAL